MNCHGDNNPCDPTNGHCSQGCDDGYYGDKCDTPCTCDGLACERTGNCINCKHGNFANGRNCIHCPVNCNGTNNPCNSNNGYCLQGCDSSFYGNKCEYLCPYNCETCTSQYQCQTCKSGYYGMDCSSYCSSCLNVQCNKDGTCQHGCTSGSYGLRCLKPCPFGCKDRDCNQDTGICTNGCTDKSYGDYCNKSCPANCDGNTCDRLTGECACSIEKYGVMCDLNCPRNCTIGTGCDSRQGTCSNGCKIGQYGPYCNESCPASCQGHTCDQSTGHCYSCGWKRYGMMCTLSCSTHCGGNGNCSMDGHCSEGCDIGWEGADCTIGKY